MAVDITGNIYKTLTFDGVNSGDYGVYISGTGVYNAPARDVEMLAIPNRNGAFSLDKGRFDNIEITYPAGIFADNEEDFANAISDFRNFLCSREGYCELADDYNPNEYRKAIYKSGLEVDPALLRAGEFEITFECMPQRFLNDGHEYITMENGQTLTNPTQYPSEPLLSVRGNGLIKINDQLIRLQGGPIGLVDLLQYTVLKVVDLADSGDTPVYGVEVPLAILSNHEGFGVEDLKIRVDYLRRTLNGSIDSITVTETSWDGSSAVETECVISPDKHSAELIYTMSAQFSKGTASSYEWRGNVVGTGTGADFANNDISIVIAYDGERTITVTPSVIKFKANGQSDTAQLDATHGPVTLESVWASSVAERLGNPTYIDCSTGEAYRREWQEGRVSVNKYVFLEDELPKLKPGDNTITWSDTIRRVMVMPRWWKV